MAGHGQASGWEVSRSRELTSEGRQGRGSGGHGCREEGGDSLQETGGCITQSIHDSSWGCGAGTIEAVSQRVEVRVQRGSWVLREKRIVTLALGAAGSRVRAVGIIVLSLREEVGWRRVYGLALVLAAFLTLAV